jgi:hypothetical protein
MEGLLAAVFKGSETANPELICPMGANERTDVPVSGPITMVTELRRLIAVFRKRQHGFDIPDGPEVPLIR